MDELRLRYHLGLDLHLGPDSLLGHAPPEPPGPLLLQACRAVVALTSGARTRVTVPLSGGTVLRLARAEVPGRLVATVNSGDGLLILDATEVPTRPFVQALAEAMSDYLHDIHQGRMRSAAKVDLTQALSLAADALAELPEPLEPPAAAAHESASGPVALQLAGDRLRVRLGSARVEVADVDPASFAEALGAALEALLHRRDWPPDVTRLPLDRRGSRALLLGRGEGLWATVVDDTQQALCPRCALTVADLAWAALQALQPAPGDDAARQKLLRLIHWEQALRQPVVAPRRAPAGWRPVAVPAPRPTTDDLPVRRLRHLAWRRDWRIEAPGLLRVEPAGPRLLIHAEGGLTAVDARTGGERWRCPEAHPLERGQAGLAADEAGALLALDGRTGRVRWRVPAEDDGPFRGAWRLRDRVLAMSDSTLFGVGAAGSAEAGVARTTWRYDTCFGQIHQVASHGPLAWMTADDGILHAVRLADGTRQFALPVPGLPEEGPLPVPQGLLVATLREPEGRGVLTNFHPTSGAVLWRIGLEGPILGPPVWLGDRAVQAHGSGGQVTLECVRLIDGEVLWRHRHLPMRGRPQLVAGDPLLVKGLDGRLWAIEPGDGRIRWALEGEDDEAHLLENTLPVWCRGVVLTPGATVRAVDPASGRLIRRLDCGELVPAWLHVSAHGDLVIAEDDAVAHYTLGGHLALV